MSMLLIYTPQNGEFFKTVLDAVASLLNEDTFKSAIDIMLILAVSMVGYQYVAGKKISAITRYILTTFFVTTCLLGIKVSVAIIDMQEQGAGTPLTVDHVPVGLALPASIISGMGYGITSLFSDVFHMPADLDYNKTGMIFGARTWLAATNARLSMSPDLAADMSAYIRQCVFAAKLLASHQITPSELVNNAELIKLYFENPSPVYRMILRDGHNLSCGEAAVNLKARLPAAAQREIVRLDQLLTKGDTNAAGGSAVSRSMEAAHDYYMKISDNAANILTQNILINATRDAASDAFAFAGADAELMNYTNTTSMQKMHVAEANSFWLASFRLPYYMTVMWMLTICIFPLIVLLAFLPLTTNVYTFYLQSQAYLWSWPPMFIIIHFFVSLAASAKLTLFGKSTGGVTFSNIDALANLHSNFAYTAGALAASVPFLAYYITKGLSSVLSNASQHFGGMAQSVSMSEAQSAAQGNISMATYSGWNMNYDNTNAHKFDTNHSHAEGRSMLQMSNGAMLAQNADGSRVGNVQPAISSSAVNVHGSEKRLDSLHKSANEHFGNSNQLRTAADTHIAAGLSEVSNFTATDGNDIRSGVGVSNTTNASFGQDLRRMKDAVTQYNKHHDSTGQTSVEAAISARINSDHSILGKLGGFIWGGSGELSATGRKGHSWHDSTQDFYNSSEEKAFTDAYHHMVTTAKNNHLDTVDTKSLHGAEQIAANFSKADSLLSQSTAEFTKGSQIQTAASYVQENASGLDDNLNQTYHDWVVEKYGARGEQVMLQVDSGSVATQHRWANEFLNSGAGISAIGAQVQHALAQTSESLHRNYDADAARLQHSNNLPEQYKQAQAVVDIKATGDGLTKMSQAHVISARDLAAQHRVKSVVDESAHIENYAAKTIKNTKIQTTEIKNKEKHHDHKQ